MTRTYRQTDCPIAKTLDLIGERWAILMLRDLLLNGPRKFQDFQDSLIGASPNMISTRLKNLEANGLIHREFYSDHPPRVQYVLTPKGKSLGSVVKALKEWGMKNLG